MFGGIFWVRVAGWTFFISGWGKVGVSEDYFGWVDIFYGWFWVGGGIFWMGASGWTTFMGRWGWVEVYFGQVG